MQREQKVYEFSGHTGNVHLTTTDRTIPVDDGDGEIYTFLPDVNSTADFMPFGMQKPGRFNNSDSYRYAFQGMEKDAEISGNPSRLNFGARIYDSRLGRWLSRDPLEWKYPSYTPYSYVNNMVGLAVDKDGRDIIVLLAPKMAGGYGHMAMLVGNDVDGWIYLSKDGVNGKKPWFGPSDKTISLPGDFPTYADFVEWNNERENLYRYTEGYRMYTNPEDKDKIIAAVTERLYADYNFFTDNCADAVEAGLRAAGLNEGICGFNYVDMPKSVPWILRQLVELHPLKPKVIQINEIPYEPFDHFTEIAHDNKGFFVDPTGKDPFLLERVFYQLNMYQLNGFQIFGEHPNNSNDSQSESRRKGGKANTYNPGLRISDPNFNQDNGKANGENNKNKKSNNKKE